MIREVFEDRTLWDPPPQVRGGNAAIVQRRLRRGSDYVNQSAKSVRGHEQTLVK